MYEGRGLEGAKKRKERASIYVPLQAVPKRPNSGKKTRSQIRGNGPFLSAGYQDQEPIIPGC
jgi:hypothetical protein